MDIGIQCEKAVQQFTKQRDITFSGKAVTVQRHLNKFPSSILFDNNYSIRDDWENKIKDFLGDTVNSVNYKLLVSHETGPVQKDLFFTRDDSGNIIYPDFFLNIINKFN